MPSILAIETSTRTGSVALACDGVVLRGETFVAERSHNSQIFAPLGELLGDARIDAVIVGTGPGSYTGVRIGIATAIGISMARNVPLFGVASVCGVEADFDYAVVGDARRGVFFWCEVKNGEIQGNPELMSLDELKLRPYEHIFTFDEMPPMEGALSVTPSAAVLAKLYSRRDLSETPQVAVEPIYLAAPFITKPKGRGKMLD
jgi:tRNA threonylcarbamoyladenosine biosynthesis protein TsaB